MLTGLSVLSLARFQFAMTTVFHFFFVPLSIGLALVVAIMETLYVVKRKPIYRQMTQFWGKIFLLSFAVGVVTGIIQEFQFGMNWSNYSRFMGDIFGAPLAIEALLAFFLESTFIGIWMFTWDKVKPVWHAVFIWLVWLGSTVSAIWILTANSFMQHPTGFAIDPTTGHVKMTSFMKLITNPQLLVEFPHVIFGAFTTGGFVVAGMAGWKLLKHISNEDVVFFTKSMKVGLWVGLVSALMTMAAGDLQTRFIVNDQPMKFAATEGIYQNTKNPAPWTVVELIDTKNKTVKDNIEIPYVLSLLTYHKLNGSVKGMNTVNRELHAKYDKKFGKDMNYYVPVKTLFWSFRVMAAGGGVLALVAIIGLFMERSKNFLKQRWFLYLMGILTFGPFVLNTCGWLITELGRYPWVVYGLQTIADAVSPTTSANAVLFTNIVYFLLFATLALFMVIYAKHDLDVGPNLTPSNDDMKDPLSKEAFKA